MSSERTRVCRKCEKRQAYPDEFRRGQGWVCVSCEYERRNERRRVDRKIKGRKHQEGSAAVEIEHIIAQMVPRGERPAWYDQRACTGQDTTRLFYPKGGEHTDPSMVNNLCLTCPVRTECVQESIDGFDWWGYRGAISGKHRKYLYQDKGLRTAQEMLERFDAEPKKGPPAIDPENDGYCSSGHAMTDSNTYTHPTTGRACCRVCRAATNKKRTRKRQLTAV